MRREAESRGLPELGDCAGPLLANVPTDCNPEAPNFTAFLMAGDEARALVAARHSMETGNEASAEMWRCIALGLEARGSHSLEALRAADSPQCHLVLSTMVEPAEIPPLIDFEALRSEQRCLALTLLATASPAEAARRFNADLVDAWFFPAAGLYAAYVPGAAAALRSVEAVEDKDGTLLVLQATMQAGVGLNALANVRLDDAGVSFERAIALIEQSREALQSERDRAQDALQEVDVPASWQSRVARMALGRSVEYERSLGELPARPATPFERSMYALLRSSSGLRTLEKLGNHISGWRAVIALVKTGETPTADDVRASHFHHDWLSFPEVFESQSPQWARHPRLPSDDAALRDAIESGDGEQIALALDVFADGSPLFYAAFAAAAGQNASVLSTHLRYRRSFLMCDGVLLWKRLNAKLLLAHVLHDDAWIGVLRQRQAKMNAHLDDKLIHVAQRYW
ncbi:MAG: hypothetical protein GXP55_06815 [Deltaproteobacteria bacterium]|nr:hypothetical protein [Deltaproteobacteria bacterium]